MAAQGLEPVPSAGTLMGIWGRARGSGTSKGCTGPGCCPNMVLHFMCPAELFRLHCGREEAEEWATPQIVSVLAALGDGHGGSGPCSPLGGFLPWPRYRPSTRPQTGGVFFFPWDVGKWVQPPAKVQGTCRGIHVPRDVNNPGLRALQSNTNLLSSLQGDISGPASGGAPGPPQHPGPPPLSAMLCWATLR